MDELWLLVIGSLGSPSIVVIGQWALIGIDERQLLMMNFSYRYPEMCCS